MHLEAGESKTVTFEVTVVDSNVTVVNQAIALEGNNELETNIVQNPVPEDAVEKDVVYPEAPTVSIDGNTVQKGETLLYKVTYHNSFEAASDVTITDENIIKQDMGALNVKKIHWPAQRRRHLQV